MKSVGAGVCQMLVTVYQSTRHHTQLDLIFIIYAHDNFRFPYLTIFDEDLELRTCSRNLWTGQKYDIIMAMYFFKI
jgi:hypothetical protein